MGCNSRLDFSIYCKSKSKSPALQTCSAIDYCRRTLLIPRLKADCNDTTTAMMITV